MIINILNDNIASGICGAAHGLSWYIQAEKNILFDTGPGKMAFENAKTLGIDPNNNDFIVLSHGHWDHGNGLANLKGGTLVAHPEIYRKRLKKSNGKSIGLDLSKKIIEDKFEVQLTSKPRQLTESIWFLGEIDRKNAWDTGYEDFILKNGQPDIVPDDSGLVAKTNQGLVVMSGCAHSGITNITLQAMRLFPNIKVHAVMGGFHLKPGDSRIQSIIDFFKSIEVRQLYPSHCTALEVICKLKNALNVRFVKTGNVFKF